MLNIPIVEQYKYLGIWIEKNGDMKYHLKNVVKQRSNYLKFKMKHYC